MKAIKFAGLVAILLAPVAMAVTTADVTYTAAASAASYDGSVLYDINAIPQDGDRWLTWNQSVRVTGDNQGLCGYVMDMRIVNKATNALAPYLFNDNADGSRYWVPTYKSAKQGGGTVSVDGTSGGPGLSTLPKLGYEQPAGAELLQFGAGFLDYTPFVKTKTGWSGAQTWGVGLDSRMSVLLDSTYVNPVTGVLAYDLSQGYIDLTGWAPGTYSIQLVVKSSAVVQSGLQLNSGGTQSGVTFDVPKENLHAVNFDFTIVPEPATLLLLAGAGLLYRRRHA